MGRKIEGILIDTKKTLNEAKAFSVDNSKLFDNLYKALCCDTVDVVERYIGGIKCSIWCDDNGLLSDEPLKAAITIHNGEIVEALVGNLFICKYDEIEEKNVSLNEYEKQTVMDSFCQFDNQVMCLTTLDSGENLNQILAHKITPIEHKAIEVVNKVCELQYKEDSFCWYRHGKDERESALTFVYDVTKNYLEDVFYTLDNNCGDPNKKEILDLKKELIGIAKETNIKQHRRK